MKQNERAKKKKGKFPPTPSTPTPLRTSQTKGHINLRKSPGHQPGVPGTPAGTNRGHFLLFTRVDDRQITHQIWRSSIEKTDRKGHFCLDTGRVSCRHPAVQRLFRNFMFSKTREGWNCRFQKTPRAEGADKVQAVSTQGSREVAFPSARNPRICSILRVGKFLSSNFPGTFPEFSLGTPEQTPETATAFSTFLICDLFSSVFSAPCL